MTGFLVHDAATAAAAVDRAVQLDRAAVRRAAEARFSANRMVADYVALYECSSGDISGALFQRYRGNPILSPNRWPYTVNAVMNAGAAEVNGTTVLLCRVEDRRGLSHLAVARSADGLSNWVVEQPPLLEPEPGVVHDSWGLEDARLTWVPELDRWVIAYTSFGPGGPGLSLATTADFHSVERLGMVRAPEDKNGALLPRRIGDHFVLLHRPAAALTGRSDIWLSRSTDLHVGAAGPVMEAAPAAGGTRPGSASDRLPSRPSRAG